MKPAKLRQFGKGTTAHIAKTHAGKGRVPPSPAQPGSAEDFGSRGAGQQINTAPVTQVTSYPPRNSGNPGCN